MLTTFFSRPLYVYTTATLLRLTLLLYGLLQDTYSPVKYTDVDYLVFTDAARFLSAGRSPYARETYRYTPLLAWALWPTAWSARGWFEFGKVLFAAADLLTGWFIVRVLVEGPRRMEAARAMRFASLWLLNPMVAGISTRGSSEGLLAVVVVAMVWAVGRGRVGLAGSLLGLGVHFKIYPFVYAVSIFWSLDGDGVRGGVGGERGGVASEVVRERVGFLNAQRLKLALSSFVTFMGLNVLMYSLYGDAFLEHSYAYHLTRIDHRHNFSVYNTVLHLSSSSVGPASLGVESLAFVPQLFLAAFAIPLALAKKDLASTMLAQTFAFVTFNKVCTSQYFLWYMVFLPFYLPDSSLLERPRLGLAALALWVLGQPMPQYPAFRDLAMADKVQALWLQQGYQLEFLGNSTFVPGLWLASMAFFLINIWILGIIVSDTGSKPAQPDVPSLAGSAEKKAM
ncbi:hypothetical protein LTR28_008059 [Elasticomyces elasticus]|nr:hypothetical protein LTR28_008059 [Elasticomyces elasticus]